MMRMVPWFQPDSLPVSVLILHYFQVIAMSLNSISIELPGAPLK